MNVFEFCRKLETITPDIIRAAGVLAVQQNSDVVIQDAIVANHPNYLTNREIPSAGETFIGKEIVGTKNFSDWDDSYEFHDNLKFLKKEDIEFTSKGKGYEAIKSNYDREDWIAPSAKILDDSTKKSIQISLVNNLKDRLK